MIINEDKLRDVVRDLLGVLRKHDLTNEEMFYVAQRFYGETKAMVFKARQQRDAKSMVGDILKDFGVFGGGKE